MAMGQEKKISSECPYQGISEHRQRHRADHIWATDNAGNLYSWVGPGLHNIPAVYGDETVRDPEIIIDSKSGMVAAGKEPGHGVAALSGVSFSPSWALRKTVLSAFARALGREPGSDRCRPSKRYKH
ncbi:hypothetical protein GGR53DRAFT_512225 [Hypoxylon sp. FL1150]|nr:hypothetical protein GGR53DRAFT_512225 [Hypoxylon sp. FL1150]